MQSQRLLFKPADHNQLQPIQLPSTCNTWYQEKVCVDTQCCDSNMHMQDRCLCVSVWADLQVTRRSAHRHVWLATCLFHHIAPETETDLMASHPQVLLFLSLSFSYFLSAFLSPSDWAKLWAHHCLTLVLSARPSYREALWLKTQNKAHTSTFEAAVRRLTVSQIMHAHARQLTCSHTHAHR